MGFPRENSSTQTTRLADHKHNNNNTSMCSTDSHTHTQMLTHTVACSAHVRSSSAGKMAAQFCVCNFQQGRLFRGFSSQLYAQFSSNLLSLIAVGTGKSHFDVFREVFFLVFAQHQKSSSTHFSKALPRVSRLKRNFYFFLVAIFASGRGDDDDRQSDFTGDTALRHRRSGRSSSSKDDLET